jgi:hypothetical protein
MEFLYYSLAEGGCWIETSDYNFLIVCLPLGGELEVNTFNNFIFNCRVKGRFIFLSNIMSGTKKEIVNGHTVWTHYNDDYHLLADTICRLNDEEIGLRNEAQRIATIYIGVLLKMDAKRPWGTRLTKDIIKEMGFIFYAALLRRAQSKL